jgi:hypothetical protein
MSDDEGGQRISEELTQVEVTQLEMIVLQWNVQAHSVNIILQTIRTPEAIQGILLRAFTLSGFITAWSIFLGKLILSQLANKFSAFMKINIQYSGHKSPPRTVSRVDRI